MASRRSRASLTRCGRVAGSSPTASARATSIGQTLLWTRSKLLHSRGLLKQRTHEMYGSLAAPFELVQRRGLIDREQRDAARGAPDRELSLDHNRLAGRPGSSARRA